MFSFINFLANAVLLLGNTVILLAADQGALSTFINANSWTLYLVPALMLAAYIIIKLRNRKQKKSICKLSMESIRLILGDKKTIRASFFEPYIFGFIKTGKLTNILMRFKLPVRLHNTSRIPYDLATTKNSYKIYEGAIGILWGQYTRFSRHLLELNNTPTEEEEFNNRLCSFAKKHSLRYIPVNTHKPYLRSYLLCIVSTMNPKRFLGIVSFDSPDPDAFSSVDKDILALVPSLLRKLAGTLTHLGRD
jgi:hypothetical protein